MSQMDNAANTNKNKYVFSYFAQLVQLGIVREVTVAFLLVGHTHCHVDQ